MMLKIMTFNVLNGWNTTNIGNRDDSAAEAVLAEFPDVLCLQEFDPCYRDAENSLSELIESSYTEVGEEKISWNAIFYNRDKIIPKAWGEKPFKKGTVYDYPRGGVSGFRTVRYALLHSIEDNTEFLVLNLHYDMCPDSETLKLNQLDESAEVVSLSEELIREYRVQSVFVTGDYNSNINGVPTVYMLNNGFLDTRAIASKSDDKATHAPLGKPITQNYERDGIDHIFYKGNTKIQVLEYKTLDNVRDASDHSPVCVTVNLI